MMLSITYTAKEKANCNNLKWNIMDTHKKASQYLRLRHRMLLGTLGALTPSLLNLYAVDLAAIPAEAFTIPYILGYSIRVLILAFYGALIAYFHKDEHNPVKIFQLGVAVPALIIILLNIGKTNADLSNVRASIWEEVRTEWFFPAAYAQRTTAYLPPVKHFMMPKQNSLREFWSGFMGEKVEERHYVVMSKEEMGWAEVRKAYRRLKIKYDVLKPEVYELEKADGKTTYVLVLANKLTKNEAHWIHNEALGKGLTDFKVMNIKKLRIDGKTLDDW